MLFCEHIQTQLATRPTMGRLKMRDMKMRDQFAWVENAGKVSMESQSVKKCLKLVVFVCRVIPSVKLYLIDECETELYWIIGQNYWWNYLRPALPILYRNAVLCLALSLCLIAYRALIVHKNTVGGEIWCSFLSTHAFLLGNGQTYATRGVPYYRVSRIFMSRIFSVTPTMYIWCPLKPVTHEPTRPGADTARSGELTEKPCTWQTHQDVCMHTNQKAHVAYSFDWCVETERFFEVAGSHVHCKSGNLRDSICLTWAPKTETLASSIDRRKPDT